MWLGWNELQQEDGVDIDGQMMWVLEITVEL